MDKKPVVLLLCGSFNPPTKSHLRILELARRHLLNKEKRQVDEGLISPVHDGYGKEGLVSSDHRRNMVTLACEGSSWLKMSPWESEQSGWLRTVCVLQHTQEVTYKNSKNVMLLMGADVFESFLRPKLWDDGDVRTILVNHGIIVSKRTGSGIDCERIKNEHQIVRQYQDRVIIFEDLINDEVSSLSSTKVRAELKKGNFEISHLVDAKVLEYIRKYKLYS